MPINLRTLSTLLILTGIISTPVLATTQADRPTDVLLRGAKNWEAKDRPDLAKNLLKKLLLIEPNSQEALFMLGNIELNNGRPEEAQRYLHTLEQTAPDSTRTQELGSSYRLATSDKSQLEKMRNLTQAGKIAEAEKILKQLFPGKPPKGELGIEYYRIIGSSKTGFSKAQSELASLYKETGDTRYRLLQLELQSNKSEQLDSAITGYEELSKHTDINTKRLQDDWRRSLYKYPDNIEKQNAIKRYLTTYLNDKEMIALLSDVQKNIAGQGVATKQNHVESSFKIAPKVLADNETETRTQKTLQSKKNEKIKKDKPAKQEKLAKHPAKLRPDTEPVAIPMTNSEPVNLTDPDIVARTDALDALADGNIELAESSLLDIIKRRPQDPEVIGGLGLVKQKQGKFSEAETWFNQALLAAQAAKGETGRWESLIGTARFSQFMTNAKALLEENKLADAENAVQQARSLKPDDPDAMAVLGNIRAAGNDLPEAERLYREALKIEGYNIFATRGLVNLLTRTQRNDEALALIEHVLKDYQNEWKKYPGSQAILLRELASLHIAAHRPSYAIKALETAVNLDPKNAWVRFSLAKLYISLDLTPLGRRVIQEGVALSPKDPTMNYVRALVMLSLDDFPAGLDSLSKIPEEEMTQSMRDLKNVALMKYYLQQADSKLDQGNRREAIRILSIAEIQARGNFQATEQIAEGWFSLGLQKQGLNAMRKLPDPAPLETQVHFASLLNRAKKDQELAEYLPSLRIPDSNDETSQKFRATIQDIELAMAGRQFDALMSAGKKEQAQQLAATVLGANQLSTSDYFKFHRTYFYKADFPENAITLLNQEKEQSPNDLNIRYELAYAYYQDKQNSHSAREIQELLSITKEDDIDTRLRIARLQQNLGDNSGAQRNIDDLIKRFPNNTDLLLQAGNMARSDGKYNQAVRYFKLAKERSLAPVKQEIPVKAAEKIAEKTAPPDILLTLLPNKSSETIAPRVTPPPLAITAESESIYRTALASAPPSVQATGNSDASYADKAIASLSTVRTAQIEAGLDIQSKTSSNGTSTYNATEIPLLARFPLGYEAHGSLQIDKVDIDSGALPSTLADAALFGKIQGFLFVPPQPLTTKVSGTSVGLGYEQQSVKADIGMAGIGFPISNVVGGIRKGGEIGRLSYSLNLSRRPYTGSSLSYAGAIDPITHVAWGGVTNTGLSLSLSTTMGDFNLGSTASFGLLRGKNVLNNDRLYLRASIDTDIYTSDDMTLNVGLNANFTSFSKNQAYFTFGHGGYYSPQSSLSFGLPIELIGRQDLLSYQIRANLSYSRTSEDSAVFYPTDPVLQARAAAMPIFPPGNNQAIYKGGTGGGFGYGLRVATEYRLTPNFAFGGRFNIERSAYYAPNSILMYLRYMFNPETGPVKLRPDPVTPYSQY